MNKCAKSTAATILAVGMIFSTGTGIAGNVNPFIGNTPIVSAASADYIETCALKNLRVTKVTINSVTLSWDKPAKTMTNFNYYLNAKGSAIAKVNGSKYSVTIKNLKPGTTYTYGVRGWNTSNYTKTSLESVTFKTEYSVAQKREIVINYAKNSVGKNYYEHSINGRKGGIDAAVTAKTPKETAREEKKITDGLDRNIGKNYVQGATDCCGLTMLAYDKIGINFAWACSIQNSYVEENGKTYNITCVGRDANGKAKIYKDKVFKIPVQVLKEGTSYTVKRYTKNGKKRAEITSCNGLLPGDLIFIASNNQSNPAKDCAHVVMYIGNGKIVHCTSGKEGYDWNGKPLTTGVMMNTLTTYTKNASWISDIVGVRRFIF